MIILHLSISAMASIVQLLAFFLIVVYSVNALTIRKAFKFGFYMMLIAHTVGQMFIAGDGRAFFVGLFIVPLFGAGIGCVSFALGKKSETKERAHDTQ